MSAVVYKYERSVSVRQAHKGNKRPTLASTTPVLAKPLVMQSPRKAGVKKRKQWNLMKLLVAGSMRVDVVEVALQGIDSRGYKELSATTVEKHCLTSVPTYNMKAYMRLRVRAEEAAVIHYSFSLRDESVITAYTMVLAMLFQLVTFVGLPLDESFTIS
eukprot:2115928-Amphidinium_carterae.1